MYAPRNEPEDGENDAAEGVISSSNNCEEIDEEVSDVCIGGGNPDFTGSIVSGSMSIELNTNVEHRPSLQNGGPSLYEPALPLELYTRDLCVHEVAVDEGYHFPPPFEESRLLRSLRVDIETKRLLTHPLTHFPVSASLAGANEISVPRPAATAFS